MKFKESNVIFCGSCGKKLSESDAYMHEKIR